jgi:hypothetical protein
VLGGPELVSLARCYFAWEMRATVGKSLHRGARARQNVHGEFGNQECSLHTDSYVPIQQRRQQFLLSKEKSLTPTFVRRTRAEI